MEKKRRKIARLNPIPHVSNYSKKLILPGFHGQSLHKIAHFFYKGIAEGSITARASSVSFNFFLALFPAIIFLFTLIPFLPIKGFEEQLLGIIQSIVPTKAYKAIESTMEDIVRHRRSGLLSFGFIVALYFSTNGINAMIEAFNRSYHINESRSFFRQRFVSLVLTIVLAFLLLIAIGLLVFSEAALYYLMRAGVLKDKFTYDMLIAGKWVIILSLFFFGISFLYYYAPAKKHKHRFFSVGSGVATVLCALMSLGFTYFVNNFGQYNKLYGSIGTLIVVLLWLYWNSIVLLIGFELNASIMNAGKKKDNFIPTQDI